MESTESAQTEQLQEVTTQFETTNQALTNLRQYTALYNAVAKDGAAVSVEDVVVLVGSKVAFDGQARIAGLEAALRELKKNKPYYFKPQSSTQTESIEHNTDPAKLAVSLTDSQLCSLFGRRADSKLANKLAKENPALYAEARKQAIARNQFGK